jgi:hypothetical protein
MTLKRAKLVLILFIVVTTSFLMKSILEKDTGNI